MVKRISTSGHPSILTLLPPPANPHSSAASLLQPLLAVHGLAVPRADTLTALLEHDPILLLLRGPPPAVALRMPALTAAADAHSQGKLRHELLAAARQGAAAPSAPGELPRPLPRAPNAAVAQAPPHWHNATPADIAAAVHLVWPPAHSRSDLLLGQAALSVALGPPERVQVGPPWQASRSLLRLLLVHEGLSQEGFSGGGNALNTTPLPPICDVRRSARPAAAAATFAPWVSAGELRAGCALVAR